MERDRKYSTEEQLIGLLFEIRLKNDPEGQKEVVRVVGTERGMLRLASLGSAECVQWLPLGALTGDPEDESPFLAHEITSVTSVDSSL